MYKKIFVALAILTIGIFSFSICFANNDHMLEDAANGVRNVVGGAENAIEDGARDIANTTKGATGAAENSMDNATGMTENANNNNNNNNSEMNGNDRTNSNTYIATRTSTTDSRFMGMNATAWTWLILGIAGIAIVALVWYYGSQMRTNHDDE